ncbi:hypothetical protein Adt_27230 [Abeliophyllum distichum]|uniref:Uncharacterized protein n=1 Tax=Abeliophyllum distichum TaxID=126358 RepID=A0ABD1RV76_9LAMI
MSNARPSGPSQLLQAPFGYSLSSLASTAASQQLLFSCSTVDIEWPAPSPSSVTTQLEEGSPLACFSMAQIQCCVVDTWIEGCYDMTVGIWLDDALSGEEILRVDANLVDIRLDLFDLDKDKK